MNADIVHTWTQESLLKGFPICLDYEGLVAKQQASEIWNLDLPGSFIQRICPGPRLS
jgi:hypothetical protein